MQGYDTAPAKVPVLSRTWEVYTEFRCYGEYWGNATTTVTLTRTPVGLVAMINGESADLHRAVSMLEGATSVKLISELLPTPTSMKASLGVSA